MRPAWLRRLPPPWRARAHANPLRFGCPIGARSKGQSWLKVWLGEKPADEALKQALLGR